MILHYDITLSCVLHYLRKINRNTNGYWDAPILYRVISVQNSILVRKFLIQRDERDDVRFR